MMLKKTLFLLFYFTASTLLAQESTIQIGQALSINNFRLKVLNGKSIDTTKIIVLDFWATWCGPCIEALPHLEEVQKKFKGKIQIVTVSDEKAQRIDTFLRKRNFELLFSIDTSKQLFKIFDIEGRPSTAIISKEKKLIWVGKSEKLDTILTSYLANNQIEYSDKNKDPAILKYFSKGKVKQQSKNTLFEYQIALSTNPGNYFAKTQHDKNQIADIQYSGAPLIEVLMDLGSIQPERLNNYRKDIDTILVDVFAKSNSSNITYGAASGLILNNLQSLFDIEIKKELRNIKAFRLKVADHQKLTRYKEEISGGGFVKRKNNTITMTRVTLEQLSLYLEKTAKKIIVFDLKTKDKFNLELGKSDNFDILRKQLMEIYGIAIEPVTENILFTVIK